MPQLKSNVCGRLFNFSTAPRPETVQLYVQSGQRSENIRIFISNSPMKPVAENVEIGKNNFSKGLFLGFTLLSLLAFFISLNKADTTKWICLAGVLLFGAAYWAAIKSKITTREDGFTVQGPFRSADILWKDIHSLSYETAYHGHTVQLNLIIQYGNPKRKSVLPVKQYQRNPMQRFFEILNEQCTEATKNDHFIKQSTGAMGWKDKLKMY